MIAIRANGPPPPPALPRAVSELTPREREVLDLLVRGSSNSEICKRLVISEATTKTHVAHILHKLDLRDRIQAVIYADENGLAYPTPATESAFRRRNQPVGRRQDRPVGRLNTPATSLAWFVQTTTRRNLMSRRLNSPAISRDPRRLLCLIALLLALAEIADAFFRQFPPGPAVFAALLLAGTLWTIRRMDAAARASSPCFVFETPNSPFWPRHSSTDWITTIAYGLIAVAGLLVATRVIFGAVTTRQERLNSQPEPGRQLPEAFVLRKARRSGPLRLRERMRCSLGVLGLLAHDRVAPGLHGGSIVTKLLRASGQDCFSSTGETLVA